MAGIKGLDGCGCSHAAGEPGTKDTRAPPYIFPNLGMLPACCLYVPRSRFRRLSVPIAFEIE